MFKHRQFTNMQETYQADVEPQFAQRLVTHSVLYCADHNYYRTLLECITIRSINGQLW